MKKQQVFINKIILKSIIHVWSKRDIAEELIE